MALQKEFSSSTGFDCPEFYISISQIVFRKDVPSEIFLVGHKNKAAKVEKKKPLYDCCIFAPLSLVSSDNIYKQAYDLIKQQEEFSTCLDV